MTRFGKIETLGSEVIFEKRYSAGWARINRPDALNTINPQVLDALERAMDVTDGEQDLAALVITVESRAAASDAFIARVSRFMDRLEAFPKPVIAAVNGIATGGGLELILCCDLVIAACTARLGDGHANFGLLPGGGGSVRLPRKIGPTRAKYLFFTGELLQAAELVAAGLVNRVVADDELDGDVIKLVESLSRKSPIALRRVKQLADGAFEQSLAQGMLAERAMSALHALSHDCQEGVRAFNEKRKPAFLGR
jgi:enoyl-CoA hydratase